MTINWPLVLQGAQIVASWPVAALVAGIAFYRPICGLLGRIKSVKGPGVEAEIMTIEAVAQQRTAAIVSEPSNNAPVDAKLLPLPTQEATPNAESSASLAPSAQLLPLPDPLESDLDRKLSEMLDARFGDNLSQKLAWAIRAKTITEINLQNEQIYRLIFGSQIAALRELSTQSPLYLVKLNTFYFAAASNPEWQPVYKTFSLEAWTNFLVAQGLIELSQNDSSPSASITPKGMRFLSWLSASPIPDTKLG